MQKDKVESIVAVILMVLLVFGIVAICNKCATSGINDSYCIDAGYDGYIKADGESYCYRIMDGTRVLTPYSVVPKVDK